MNQMQRTIAADKIRRQREARERQAELQNAFYAGMAAGKSQRPPPVQLSVSLVEAVTTEMAGMLARDAFTQNRDRSAAVCKVLADIVEQAVKDFPWNLADARQFAEYIMEENGDVRFDFSLHNLRGARIVDRLERLRFA
jgi:hypothetical protein